MANLGSDLWQSESPIHSLRVTRIQDVGPCEFKRWCCFERAHTQIEIRNGLGISFWRRDLCGRRAEPPLAATEKSSLWDKDNSLLSHRSRCT